MIATEGRLVDRSSSSVVDWTYRDLVVSGADAGLRVAEWNLPVLRALRGARATAPRYFLVAATAPRWTILLPLVTVLGFGPLLLAWANGQPVSATVTGHDPDYYMCDVEWAAPGGHQSATVDCDLEPVGSTLTVRALGFPVSGEAADVVWTLDMVGTLVGLSIAVSAVCLAVHLPIVLRLPSIDLATAGPAPVDEPDDVVPSSWQRRALAQARLDGFRPRAQKRSSSAPARWVTTTRLVAGAGGGYLTTALLLLFFATLFLSFSLPAMWALSREPISLATVEVVEGGDLTLPFLTRESSVRTEGGEELWLTTWRALDDGERLTVQRAGDVLALPNDPGHEIEALEGFVTLVPGLFCAGVAWRRGQRALAALPSRGRREGDEEVPYAAFRLPDGTSLMVLLHDDDRPELTVPVKGHVGPVGVASVPKARRCGDLLAPLVGGRLLLPAAEAQALDEAELQDLLDEIS
ncbi:MAG TPA: hypothetical protein VFX41_02925 [Actinomycetales bacterium]|nr:hypothetical protein [Actinomycetales bacterium]